MPLFTHSHGYQLPAIDIGSLTSGCTILKDEEIIDGPLYLDLTNAIFLK